ncbi:MAG: 3-hydroxyacyl-CoA dehydrogenase [Solirubrobacterales bacterium]|nr:3-hydroxyacyl-CoA dehydrogenase [Solirubrobacterales bacterium]MBV9714265.1 3-hydroxyacyl-CoA dehydrogenase [Solirubrobacterales bacterium]
MTSPSPSDLLAGSDVLKRNEHVAVIGAGLIGISWTALLLAHGLEVRVYDPDPAAQSRCREGIERIAPSLTALGLPVHGLAERLRFETELTRAVRGAAVVQENGPEDLALKRHVWAQVQQSAPPETLLLSSTSGLPATAQAQHLARPGRLVVGHPFNPPHLVPLVEVVPGQRTDPQAVEDALAFYRALGKQPVVLRREIPGFVANRLQSALFRECVSLVTQGIVAMEDLDAIVTSSIGLRWAAAGPFLSFHLGGGPGGLAHFFAHFAPGMQRRWDTLGRPRLDDATIALLAREVERAYGDTSIEALERERDDAQIAMLRARQRGQ